MKKNTLKFLGIMVLSVGVLAGAAAGCGSKETGDVAGTEVVVATETEEETELPEETEVTETTETELPQETETPAFAVTELSATKYATQTVNVRKGPGSDHEKLGSLTAGQKVTVTGQADTGWYKIDHNGTEGYVSDKYLSDQKVSAPAKNTGGSAASGSDGANAGNTGAAGNTGNAENVNNTGNTNNAGNGGNTGSTGNTNTGNTDSAPAPDNSGSTPAPDNSGSTPAPDNSGNTGNAGGADQGGATVPDNSGSTDAGNNGGTDAGNTGGGDASGNSGAPSDNWWESPEFDDVEDFVPQPGTGADDGSGLSGGTSEWH